jgi:hypothetical protein
MRTRFRVSARAALFALFLLPGGLSAQADSALAITRGGASLLRVNIDGRVGVGTSDPQQRLHVAGTVRADSGVVFGDGSVQSSAAVVRFAADTSLATPFLSAGTCVNQASVTITAPADGVVMVRALARVRLDHTSGTIDRLGLHVATGPSDCSLPAYVHDIPAGVGTASEINHSATVDGYFNVSAGSHTFYLNGQMHVGASAMDYMYYSFMSATFIRT